ncbi:hypothetical protein PKB_5652 [Pseudomonas knackmussii B13]|nr:hypothetical protein PKB_5652 [Pseudomonas knackmussii B13]
MRELIRLVSSAGTGHFYTTDKNKRTKPEKIEIKKFDPVVRKHVIYKEAKIIFCLKKSRRQKKPRHRRAFSVRGSQAFCSNIT